MEKNIYTNKNHNLCIKCILSDAIEGVRIESDGICNYCKLIEQLENEYKTGTPDGEKKLLEIIDKIKKEGKNKKYDCVIGVSGGTDSSFLLYKAIELGLRPLAVHYDNTWNSAIATENIRKITTKLNIDLHTHVVNNKEVDDIFKSFFKASVIELDACTDIALIETLYRAASKYKVKYILDGHSFRAEGVAPPIGYIDGKYIKTIQKSFGAHKIDTFPNMSLIAFLKWMIIKRIKRIRPYWYLDYSKEETRVFLEKEFDWKYYGGHHLENRMTAFQHSFYCPVKFGVDQTYNSLSALVRSGRMEREKALDLFLNNEPYLEPELVEYFKKRLGFSDEEFDNILKKPVLTYKNFKTYKQSFEKLKPLFWLMYKLDLVPKSFYVKYTAKGDI